MTDNPICGYPLNSFCAQLSDSTRCQLCTIGQCVEFRKNKKLYTPSYRARIYLICKGLAVQNAALPSGNQLCIRFAASGSMPGASLMFGNKPIHEKKEQFLYVIKPLTGCLFFLSDLEALFLNNIEFAKAIQRQTGLEELRMTRNMLSMVTYNSKDKIRYLLSVLEGQQVHASDITHEEIATILNLNRVTVTRAMKEILQEQ